MSLGLLVHLQAVLTLQQRWLILELVAGGGTAGRATLFERFVLRKAAICVGGWIVKAAKTRVWCIAVGGIIVRRHRRLCVVETLEIALVKRAQAIVKQIEVRARVKYDLQFLAKLRHIEIVASIC